MKWIDKFNTFVDYLANNDNNIPAEDVVVGDNFYMGAWIRKQVIEYKNGSLTAEQKLSLTNCEQFIKLTQMHVHDNTNKRQANWDKHYDDFVIYMQNHNNIYPVSHDWFNIQVKKYVTSSMVQYQRTKMDELPNFRTYLDERDRVYLDNPKKRLRTEQMQHECIISTYLEDNPDDILFAHEYDIIPGCGHFGKGDIMFYNVTRNIYTIIECKLHSPDDARDQAIIYAAWAKLRFRSSRVRYAYTIDDRTLSIIKDIDLMGAYQVAIERIKKLDLSDDIINMIIAIYFIK